jgi:hypothetical protein
VICRIATLKYDFILKHKLDIKGGSEGFSDFNLLEGSEFQLAIANYQ